MKYEKHIYLKDGRGCVVRNASANDGPQVAEVYARQHEETDELLVYPDEITVDGSQESVFLDIKEKSSNEVELVAVTGGRIVGLAGIDSLGDKMKLRHRASMGISVSKEYWSLGIGKELLSACIECARRAGYKQLELEVMSDNERAIRLYEKQGFAEYGRNPRGFMERDGSFRCLIYYRLEL